MRDGELSGKDQEVLEEYFPGEFSPPHDDGRQLVDKIDDRLRQLCPLHDQVAAIEELNLDSKIRAAALPGSGAVDKLTRYETANDRALDRALHRLESMQARRRERGGAPAKQ